MTIFAIALAVGIVLIGTVFGGHMLRHRGEGTSPKTLFITGFAGVLLLSSLGVYATLGRWNDYEKAEVDHDVDYLLAAKITEAQRRVQMQPGNAFALKDLAQIYFDAGKYGEAVAAVDKSLAIMGANPDLLGLKVNALYYRDARTITSETQAVIDEVLAKNALHVQTRMLLGQDAYLNGRYAEAVSHWKMLLEAGVAPDKVRALETAVAKAEAKLNQAI